MNKVRVVLGFDMETDIGSWTPWYNGLVNGTPVILEILKKHGVSGTFYFTGDSCRKHPGVPVAVRAAGHEIGCHTLFHETIGEPLFEIPGMMPILPEEVEPRIRQATEWVEAAAGIRPVSFRCPRLFGSTAVANALEDLGYLTDATYPMYYFREQLAPYHPSRDDWTKPGDMKLLELPNFADLSMASQDEYGRDLDQWPLFRTQSADKLMEHINGYVGYCEQQGVEPFLCFYFHPWEFWPMPEGLLHYGEGAVMPDQFLVKNCGEYGAEQFDRLLEKLTAMGTDFCQAGELAG
ncbi:MAG: hypothetical protein DRP71_12325 [Verrucomicrobia bacterium]|nr:MAG: hypothetical protein DRP71_12325 [Verrucomicrobiota bacterium]